MGMEVYGRTLSHSVLTGLVREFVPSDAMIGKTIFKTKPVMAQTVGIDVITNPRHLARYRHPDAPSAKQALKAVRHIDVTIPTIKESKAIPSSILLHLRQPGTEHQQYGRQAVTEELDGLDIIAENRLEKSRWDILQTGILAQSAASVDEVAFSIDFGIDTESTPALSGDERWSVPASCDPIGDIQDWKKRYARLSGKAARYGFLTSTVMGYLMASTAVQALMGDRMKDEIFVKGAISKLCNLALVEYDLGYVPEGGSFTTFLGEDKFVLWSGDVFPEHQGIFNDLAAKTPGKFSKSWEEEDPSGVQILEGVCDLPSGERVKELFCATVHAAA